MRTCLRPLLGHGGVDGDPAHEQLNDLLALGLRGPPSSRSRISESTSSETASPERRCGFVVGQPLIELLSSRLHLGGDGVELDFGELAAGVEVDGALAALLSGFACCGEGDAFGLGDGAGLRVVGLREELVDEVCGLGEEAGDIGPDGVFEELALDRGADALARKGPRSTMEPLHL